MPISHALKAILGNRSVTYVLLFLQQHGEGHASLIAKTYGVSPTGIQRQLNRLEDSAVVVSRPIGRTRVFSLNDREPTVAALRQFLAIELDRALVESDSDTAPDTISKGTSRVRHKDGVCT